MGKNSGYRSSQSNYKLALAFLFVGFLTQIVVFLLIPHGVTQKIVIAIVLDFLIATRIIIGRTIDEGGKGWIFYALLPFILIPILEVAYHLWLH